MEDLSTSANLHSDADQEVLRKKNTFPFLILFLSLFIGLYAVWLRYDKPTSPRTHSPMYATFSSEEDFISYIQDSQQQDSSFMAFGSGFSQMDTAMMTSPTLARAEMMDGKVANRISTTNTQVGGIDEPDIVKTDGTNIFTSLFTSYGMMPTEPPTIEPLMMESIVSDEMASSSFLPPERITQNNSIYSAFPPADLEKSADLPAYGEMLYRENVLAVFEHDQLTGFDVSDAQNPDELWSLEIQEDTSIYTSRLYGENIYLITRTNIDQHLPCPLRPLSLAGNDLMIPCEQIYRPNSPTQIDGTFTVFKIDIQTGEVLRQLSFVGSSQSSTIYMSSQHLYITSTSHADMADFYYMFFNSVGTDLVSPQVIDALDRLSSYEISSNSKMTEIQIILNRYFSSLDDDEAARIQNEISNRMSDFASQKMREMETTSIAKIDISDLSMKEFGSVPGRPLNQFSLDEHNEHLRIATTVGGRTLVGSTSENDVYVLNEDMIEVGAIQGMGLDEKIYSVRFMGDSGYLVTFRETDPFYVLNLQDPSAPIIEGELKIPGFSSYLHPLRTDEILGVGRDEGKVKLSLFDVSNPQKPTEKSKYLLDAYWSDVQNTHHAFLQDEKHEIFFIPAGQSGHIFSYADGTLKLLRVVSDVGARRALFLDDYLYVVGDEKIIVLDESNAFETIRELSL